MSCFPHFTQGRLVNDQRNYKIPLTQFHKHHCHWRKISSESVWILWYASFHPRAWAARDPSAQRKLLNMKLIGVAPWRERRIFLMLSISSSAGTETPPMSLRCKQIAFLGKFANLKHRTCTVSFQQIQIDATLLEYSHFLISLRG